jgi:GntR family transcriptional regulator
MIAADPRPGTRYSTLARALTEEIESGRVEVGAKLPTEAELQERFDVSRHTVREALRELKAQGLVVARPGIGTVVRAGARRPRLMQGVGTLHELIQLAEVTHMRLLKKRPLIADSLLAGRIGVKPGQQLHVASVLRFLPDAPTPVASLFVYVRPEHSEVLELIEPTGLPIFMLLERRHGVRIVEVSQQIVATALEAGEARALKACVGTPALEITRRYADAQDRFVMASVGLYPSDRFSHTTKFRVQNTDHKEGIS